MKIQLFTLLISAAGLSGCAVYPAPAYDAYGQPSPAYVTAPAPVYIYGSGVYRHNHPGYAPAHPAGRYGPGDGHGGRDRDHDGIPDYRDRDRDGDGVRNRYDRDPNNPYRR